MNPKFAFFVALLIPFKSYADPDTDAIYHLDPDQTQIRVHLGKSGLFGFMGDNHIIDVRISEGSLLSDSSSHQPQTLQFTIPTSQIKVLDPDLADETRVEVQKKMEGEDVLNVLDFPTLQFASTGFIKSKDANSWRIPGKMTVKDKTANVEITAAIDMDSSGFSAKGEAKLKLTDLGIKPPGVGAGTIKVKNLFTVDFESHGKK